MKIKQMNKLKAFFGENIKFDYIHTKHIVIRYDIFENDVWINKWFQMSNILKDLKLTSSNIFEETIFNKARLYFDCENYVKFKINDKVYSKEELDIKLDKIIDELIEENEKIRTNNHIKKLDRQNLVY